MPHAKIQDYRTSGCVEKEVLCCFLPYKRAWRLSWSCDMKHFEASHEFWLDWLSGFRGEDLCKWLTDVHQGMPLL